MTLIKKYWRELALVLIVLELAIGAVWKLNNPSEETPLPFPIPTPTADQPVDVLYIRSDQFLEAQGALRKGGPISEAYPDGTHPCEVGKEHRRACGMMLTPLAA